MSTNIDLTDTDTFKKTLISLFEQMQDQRSSLAETVRDANLAARPLFQLEAQRLAAKLGADDPRVAAMQARADNRLNVANALATEQEIAAIRVPKVSQDATLIQGRLTDAKLSSLPNITVRLVDSQGKDLGVAPVKTDGSGYYAFTVTPELAKSIGAGRAVTVAVGDLKTGFVPETAPTISFTPGAHLTAEVALKGGDLQKVVGRIDLSRVVKARVSDTLTRANAPTDMATPSATDTKAKTTRRTKNDKPDGEQ